MQEAEIDHHMVSYNALAESTDKLDSRCGASYHVGRCTNDAEYYAWLNEDEVLPLCGEHADVPWQDDYPTTTHRGPQQYPVPEDWVLGIVEADGMNWRRYNDAEEANDAERKDQLDDDVLREGPDDELGLLHEVEGDVLDPDREYWVLSLNGEEITELDGDATDYFGEIAELMARYARGEDYDDIFDDEDEDEGGVQSQTLGDFGGDA
jgi:hypothetical protein